MKPEDFFNQLNQLPPTMRLAMAVLLIVLIVIQLLYFWTLQRTMNALAPTRRPFPGATIWIGLVPLIGVVWYMVFIVMLSISIRKEFLAHGTSGAGALNITLATVTLTLLLVLAGAPIIFSLPTFVFMLIHWQRMASYRKHLANPGYLYVD